jgi:hypothetical protein
MRVDKILVGQVLVAHGNPAHADAWLCLRGQHDEATSCAANERPVVRHHSVASFQVARAA